MHASHLSTIEPAGRFIVDAHQDIAFHCLEYNRDFVDPGTKPCMIALPWLQRAGFRLVCATLFTHPSDNPATRHYKMHSQYQLYQQWLSRYPEQLRLIRTAEDLTGLASAGSVETAQGKVYPVGIVLLIEGLDLLENPAELYTWFNRGVRMVGVTWNGRNQYASGCFADRRGFTNRGYTLLDEMARLGVILDTSHLSRRAVDEALEHYRGPVCAGHTNAAAVCDIERNLTDAQAQETARRGGVIGLNLLASLVKSGWRRGDPLPTLSDAIAHTLHLASLVGSNYVGLGVDLDGGLTPENTPAGINRIDDIPLLANELDRHGWHPQQVADFMGRNWWRFFERSLPQ